MAQGSHPVDYLVAASTLAFIQREQPSIIVIECSAIPDIEYTALKQLTDLEGRLREAGIVLWLAALIPEPLRSVERSSIGETLGRERMFFNWWSTMRPQAAQQSQEQTAESPGEGETQRRNMEE